ncbi:HNH endonuclease [Paenibacillus terreus]|uniref:HNH endonuclease n=1 Tax=Paenibacillus terreus TaxID=1387834 RepID=A0ABV5BEZ7_9BACL
MNRWLEDIKNALSNLGGVAEYPQIYEAIYKKRGGNLPKTWKQIIQRTIQTHSSDSNAFSGGKDMFYSVKGIGNGVWGLRENRNITLYGSDINDDIPTNVRKYMTVYRILRDTELARFLKQLHQNKCQICGETLKISNKKMYSEAHHIKPLGVPHSGPDIAENIIILCPNHHALLDFGALELSLGNLLNTTNHKISKEFIDYHNENIYKSFD